MKNTIHLDKSGSFLLRSPTKITMTVNRELAVVFSVPTKKVCGVVLFYPEEDLKILYQSLTNLFERTLDALGITGSTIQVKIFGLRTGTGSVIEGLLHWLKENNLKVYAKDVGANACRNLMIDCATGMVGVSYCESTNPSQLPWVSEGTAKNRNPMETISGEVLILSENPVRRTLAKQAIEEYPQWGTATPKRPTEILTGKFLDEFPWSVVLIFDDIDDEKSIDFWLSRVKMRFPSVQFRWVGTSIPISLKRSHPELKHLPPLEPELLPEFKKKLQSAVLEHYSSNTSDLLQFPKIRKA